jgi:hypothetical protein
MEIRIVGVLIIVFFILVYYSIGFTRFRFSGTGTLASSRRVGVRSTRETRSTVGSEIRSGHRINRMLY